MSIAVFAIFISSTPCCTLRGLLTVRVNGARKQGDSRREQQTRGRPGWGLLKRWQSRKRQGVKELILGGGLPVVLDLVAALGKTVGPVRACKNKICLTHKNDMRGGYSSGTLRVGHQRRVGFPSFFHLNEWTLLLSAIFLVAVR